MLPGAICGETVKRQTIDREIMDEDPLAENKSSVYLKGKALRKLGDVDYY
jgi:hypothetical protein